MALICLCVHLLCQGWKRAMGFFTGQGGMHTWPLAAAISKLLPSPAPRLADFSVHQQGQGPRPTGPQGLCSLILSCSPATLP